MNFSYQGIKNSATSLFWFCVICLIPTIPLLPSALYIYMSREMKYGITHSLIISFAVSFIFYKIIFKNNIKYGIYVIILSTVLYFTLSLPGGIIISFIPIATSFYFTIKGLFLN